MMASHPPPTFLQAIKAFRAKLEAKRFPIGPSIGIKDPVVTDGIADEVDYIWYDQEHSTMVRPPLHTHSHSHSGAQPYPLPAARRAPTSCRTTSSQRTAVACRSSSASPAPTSATPPRPA